MGTLARKEFVNIWTVWRCFTEKFTVEPPNQSTYHFMGIKAVVKSLLSKTQKLFSNRKKNYQENTSIYLLKFVTMKSWSYYLDLYSKG